MNLPEWNELFAPDGADSRVSLCVVRKHGEPLLLLPRNTRAAAQCLDLYPAQTAKARLARAALRLALRLGSAPLATVELPWSEDGPMPDLLGSLNGGVPLEFGILLGNPRAPGRRWIVLLFQDGVPFCVVKAGVSPRARALIVAEAVCLDSLPRTLAGRPEVVCRSSGNDFEALATRYVRGAAPSGAGDGRTIGALLSLWLDPARRVALADVPAWQRVRAYAPAELLAHAEREFGAEPFAATVMHGDFAPWNIREHAGGWVVLDWERGETTGVPGWDWLHFVVQHAVLVRRLPASEVAALVWRVFESEPFRAFATRAGIAGRERAVFLGYLLHAVEVLRQTEGIAAMRELLAVARESPGEK